MEIIINAVSPISVDSSNLWSTGNTIKSECWQLGAKFKLFILVVSCNPWCSTVWCDSVMVMGVVLLWLSKNCLSVDVRCSDVLSLWIFFFFFFKLNLLLPGLWDCRGLRVLVAQAFAQSPVTASSRESLLSTSCYNWIPHLLLAGATFRQQGAE